MWSALHVPAISHSAQHGMGKPLQTQSTVIRSLAKPPGIHVTSGVFEICNLWGGVQVNRYDGPLVVMFCHKFGTLRSADIHVIVQDGRLAPCSTNGLRGGRCPIAPKKAGCSCIEPPKPYVCIPCLCLASQAVSETRAREHICCTGSRFSPAQFVC